MSHSKNPFRSGSMLAAISEYLLEGKTREEIFRIIYPRVMRQEAPFVFSDNAGGRRVAKPIYDQIPLAFYSIGRARNSLLEKAPNAISFLASEDRFSNQNYENKRWRARLFDQVKTEYESGTLTGNDPVIEPVSEPVYSGIRHKLERLYIELNRLRGFCNSKRVGNREFDYISTRAFVHGKAAILAGIEVDDFLVSIGASWSPETRREAGIKDSVDYSRYPSPDGMPKVAGFVLALIAARIPVYLYGPTGSGKSVLASKIADYLSLSYGEIPLSCGVSRTDLFGNWNAKGFVSRPLGEIYSNGGIYCFEEMDAADPNILLSVNNAVANQRLFNTSNGETIERHSDFIPIATANTLGNGATANYSAREGLDGSTLDRFKYGRVFCDYDSDIESEIIFGNIEDLENAELSASL